MNVKIEVKGYFIRTIYTTYRTLRCGCCMYAVFVQLVGYRQGCRARSKQIYMEVDRANNGLTENC